MSRWSSTTRGAALAVQIVTIVTIVLCVIGGLMAAVIIVQDLSDDTDKFHGLGAALGAVAAFVALVVAVISATVLFLVTTGMRRSSVGRLQAGGIIVAVLPLLAVVIPVFGAVGNVGNVSLANIVSIAVLLAAAAPGVVLTASAGRDRHWEKEVHPQGLEP